MPFGAFVQVGEGIEGLVHISEMAEHHVETPDQVVTPGEELWVKIIDLDLDRRRISLSIKQAAEGGVVAEEYRDIYGEHAFDEEGNYVGPALEGVHEEAEGEAGARAEGDAAAAGEAGAEGDVVAAAEGEAPSPDEVAGAEAAVREGDEGPSGEPAAELAVEQAVGGEEQAE